MLLDRLMPSRDATRTEHHIISAPVSIVYSAAMNTDFMDAVRDSLAVRERSCRRQGQLRTQVFWR
jgi:hypothetical protein